MSQNNKTTNYSCFFSNWLKKNVSLYFILTIAHSCTILTMTRLSVNINKIATLRNARGENIPNVLKVAEDCQRFGADGITVHPRPDERHIRQKDVFDLQSKITTEFNIEGYPSPEFISLVKRVKPNQVTFVPDLPNTLTSNVGWDTVTHEIFLSEIVGDMQAAGIRTSLFMGTDLEKIKAASRIGTDRVELFTGPYAKSYAENKEEAIAPFIEAAQLAKNLGLGINAGHDLNLENLNYLITNIPWIKEVSIGHALISDALYMGLEKTIKAYKNCLIAL